MVVWRALKGLLLKGTTRFGPSVGSFLITSGARKRYIIGAYGPPNDVPTVHHIEQVLRAETKGLYMILVGDLNARLGDPRDKREEDLEKALVDRGLINMTYHFMPQ